MTEVAVMEEDQGSAQSPLVTVSFQKNEQRTFKFLEGEPKALGITQICLSIFHISCIAALFSKNLLETGLEIPSFVLSILIFIAGNVAIAAKNLHLPTVRACLGMEVVAAMSSITIMAFNIIKMIDFHIYCYLHEAEGEERKNCRNTESAHQHLMAELLLIEVALFAIAVTLVVYAAKVAHCCSPEPKVPVITIQAQPARR